MFQYICYPWKDDSGVAASEKRDLCRRSSDCRKPGQECQRHQDRRKINKGLCMNEVRSILDTNGDDEKLTVQCLSFVASGLDVTEFPTDPICSISCSKYH